MIDWKQVLNAAGPGLMSTGSALMMTGIGAIPGGIMMGLGAASSIGAAFMPEENTIGVQAHNVTNQQLAGGIKAQNGVSIPPWGSNSIPWHRDYSLGVSISPFGGDGIPSNQSRVFPDVESRLPLEFFDAYLLGTSSDPNRMPEFIQNPYAGYSFPKEKKMNFSLGVGINMARPITPKVVPTGNYIDGYQAWQSVFDNINNVKGAENSVPPQSLIAKAFGDNYAKVAGKYMATPGQAVFPNPKPADMGKPGTRNVGTYSDMLDQANKANKIGAISQGVVGLASFINELNAKKSADMMTPSDTTVNLDKDQSSFINAMNEEIGMGVAATNRMAVDMGANPLQMALSSQYMSHMAKLKTLATADQTRQQITMKEAEINASKSDRAIANKMNVDQFNIQKRITENDASSKNLSNALAMMASAYPSMMQANFGNQIAIERLAKGLY